MDQTLDNINFIKLWPTTIMSTTFITDIKVLQQEIYQLATIPNTIQKSNYGGWQSNADLQSNPVFNSLCEYIKTVVTSATGYNSVKCHQMWAGINKKHDFNTVHSHSNSFDFSGVYYVKVPNSSGSIAFRDPRPGQIHNGRKLYVSDCEYFIPFECMLLIFPSWLEHFVMPNQSDDDRICISFDITLEN